MGAGRTPHSHAAVGTEGPWPHSLFKAPARAGLSAPDQTPPSTQAIGGPPNETAAFSPLGVVNEVERDQVTRARP